MKRVNFLIADSGSTKTSWYLSHQGKEYHFQTQGISPYFLQKDEMKAVLQTELIAPFPVAMDEIEEVFFYGTGMAAEENKKKMGQLLSEIFFSARVEVTHDVYAAARGLCGHHHGLACILGTGSGICFFDGTTITRWTPGLGFILGDEGSGADLGKRLLSRILYKEMDEDLLEQFKEEYQVTKPEILEAVYKKPYPNRYLASFTPFLSKNRGNVSVEAIIVSGIDAFFRKHVEAYLERFDHPIHFVGGVAFAFQDVIRKLCMKYRLTLGKIEKNPMAGLIEYHKEVH